MNLPIHSVVIDHASAGDNELVALVQNKRIRAISLVYVAAGTVTVRFESGPGGDALTGQMSHTAQNGAVLPRHQDGWFQTNVGESLNMELSAGVSVDGVLTYVLAD